MPSKTVNYRQESSLPGADEDLSRAQKPYKKAGKLNCWEFINCGREPSGNKVSELCECPAAVIKAIPDGQYNGGICFGRRCWRMAGTLCNNEIQGTFSKKINSCRQCLFYLKVKKEEGENFVE